MKWKEKRDLRPRAQQKQAVQGDGTIRRTLSFYKYVHFTDPEAVRRELFTAWGALGCLGRIYVAHEGINAQMSVPKASWAEFERFMKSRVEYQDIPFKLAVEEGSAPAFYKLSIRHKAKIVADGLDDTSFDVTNTGTYLTAAQMNEYIDDPEAIVIDMRNNYESEIGYFKGAITPDVKTFRDELRLVPKKLRVHKNKKIALYCTGGIRCEKASAWLKHSGFTNVRHLKGGIIDYKHQVEASGLANYFKGRNFVFDERMSERIGTEIVSTCHLCRKVKCDTYHDCRAQVCHRLFIGCDTCVKKRHGFCSYRCQTLDRLPSSVKKRFTRLLSTCRRIKGELRKVPLY